MQKKNQQKMLINERATSRRNYYGSDVQNNNGTEIPPLAGPM
jgi:hypothetical protein